MPDTTIAGRPDRLTRLMTPDGTSTAATLSFRDALSRAEQIECVDEALGLLRLAALSGDSDLARAVALRAVDEVRSNRPDVQQWREVLHEWADGDDRGPAVLVDLDALAAAGDDR